ncbi:glyceraldehyde-3-phosphate dehydrogenase [Gallaecimonas sp. GXIMD1310]|uniref:glyceraldehyde-3-phosphate dehydrogenase n=1 Tax=Gallaecimonas sp. GXIMD1310 TaxID=3131926 RepID=UPI003255C813
MSNTQPDIYLNSWQERQELAEQMQPMIGRLYRNFGVELVVYGKPLLNASTIDIIKAHRMVRQFESDKLRLRESFPLIEALSGMKLAPARIDLGKLAVDYLRNHGDKSVDAFLRDELSDIVEKDDNMAPKDVVLYGFGRIGRLLARLLIERTGPRNKLRLRAIVVRGGRDGDLQKRASLLRRDSIHGPFNGSIWVDEEESAIVANGCYIKVIYANQPEEIDYTAYGIDDALIIDNTGVFKDEGLARHLSAKGAAKVLLTAPSGGGVKNIVYGVNNDMIAADDTIISAASCTTNAITPVLKAINDRYGIEYGHVETVHSYTNDQNLIDNYHKAERRGRSAPLNMVLTSTGAAKAVAKALPELAGKLTGNAIRVPTPNVSMAILNLTLKETVSREQVNDFLSETSLSSDLRDQIDFSTSTEIVSSDLVGSRYAGVVDSQATLAQDNHVVLYVWYDNEFGYSCQVVRVAQDMAGLYYPSLPR